jgi:hypothetical protein
MIAGHSGALVWSPPMTNCVVTPWYKRWATSPSAAWGRLWQWPTHRAPDPVLVAAVPGVGVEPLRCGLSVGEQVDLLLRRRGRWRRTVAEQAATPHHNSSSPKTPGEPGPWVNGARWPVALRHPQSDSRRWPRRRPAFPLHTCARSQLPLKQSCRRDALPAGNPGSNGGAVQTDDSGNRLSEHCWGQGLGAPRRRGATAG